MLQNWIEAGITPMEAAREVVKIDEGLEMAVNSGAISEAQYCVYIQQLYDLLNEFDAWFNRKASRNAIKNKNAIKGGRVKRVYRIQDGESFEVCGRGAHSVTVHGKAKRINPISKKSVKPTLVAVKNNGVKASDIRATEFSSKAVRHKLFNLSGCQTYVNRTWIWVKDASGEANRGATKKHREFLKSLGFRWSRNSGQWYKKDAVMDFAW